MKKNRKRGASGNVRWSDKKLQKECELLALKIAKAKAVFHDAWAKSELKETEAIEIPSALWLIHWRYSFPRDAKVIIDFTPHAKRVDLQARGFILSNEITLRELITAMGFALGLNVVVRPDTSSYRLAGRFTSDKSDLHEYAEASRFHITVCETCCLAKVCVAELAHRAKDLDDIAEATREVPDA